MSDETGQMPEKPKKKPKKLSKQQKLFILEYVKTENAQQSAITAGYSKISAHVIGHRLLKRDNVLAEIERLQAINAKNLEIEHGISMKDLRKRLVDIGFSTLKDYATWDDRGLELLDSNKITPFGLKSIKIKRTSRTERGTGTEIEEITTSITLDDRIKALIALGEHVGLFNKNEGENGDQSGNKLIDERVLELAGKFKATGTC